MKKKRALSASRFLFGTAIAMVFAIGAFQTIQPTFAGGTCETKHCSANTHCCYGCTANPICVKNGVPCPECAPQ